MKATAALYAHEGLARHLIMRMVHNMMERLGAAYVRPILLRRAEWAIVRKDVALRRHTKGGG